MLPFVLVEAIKIGNEVNIIHWKDKAIYNVTAERPYQFVEHLEWDKVRDDGILYTNQHILYNKPEPVKDRWPQFKQNQFDTLITRKARDEDYKYLLVHSEEEEKWVILNVDCDDESDPYRYLRVKKEWITQCPPDPMSKHDFEDLDLDNCKVTLFQIHNHCHQVKVLQPSGKIIDLQVHQSLLSPVEEDRWDTRTGVHRFHGDQDHIFKEYVDKPGKVFWTIGDHTISTKIQSIDKFCKNRIEVYKTVVISKNNIQKKHIYLDCDGKIISVHDEFDEDLRDQRFDEGTQIISINSKKFDELSVLGFSGRVDLYDIVGVDEFIEDVDLLFELKLPNVAYWKSLGQKHFAFDTYDSLKDMFKQHGDGTVFNVADRVVAKIGNTQILGTIVGVRDVNNTCWIVTDHLSRTPPQFEKEHSDYEKIGKELTLAMAQEYQTIEKRRRWNKYKMQRWQHNKPEENVPQMQFWKRGANQFEILLSQVLVKTAFTVGEVVKIRHHERLTCKILAFGEYGDPEDSEGKVDIDMRNMNVARFSSLSLPRLSNIPPLGRSFSFATVFDTAADEQKKYSDWDAPPESRVHVECVAFERDFKHVPFDEIHSMDTEEVQEVFEFDSSELPDGRVFVDKSGLIRYVDDGKGRNKHKTNHEIEVQDLKQELFDAVDLAKVFQAFKSQNVKDLFQAVDRTRVGNLEKKFNRLPEESSDDASSEKKKTNTPLEFHNKTYYTIERITCLDDPEKGDIQKNWDRKTFDPKWHIWKNEFETGANDALQRASGVADLNDVLKKSFLGDECRDQDELPDKFRVHVRATKIKAILKFKQADLRRREWTAGDTVYLPKGTTIRKTKIDWDAQNAIKENYGTGQIHLRFHGDPSKDHHFWEFPEYLRLKTPRWDTYNAHDFCTNKKWIGEDGETTEWKCMGHGPRKNLSCGECGKEVEYRERLKTGTNGFQEKWKCDNCKKTYTSDVSHFVHDSCSYYLCTECAFQGLGHPPKHDHGLRIYHGTPDAHLFCVPCEGQDYPDDDSCITQNANDFCTNCVPVIQTYDGQVVPAEEQQNINEGQFRCHNNDDILGTVYRCGGHDIDFVKIHEAKKFQVAKDKKEKREAKAKAAERKVRPVRFACNSTTFGNLSKP